MAEPSRREYNNAASRRWRERNPEKNRERARAWNAKVYNYPEPTRPMSANCECCGVRSNKRLHLDHDHKTGEFRGWLCHRCNSGIGMLNDSVAGVQAALDYLTRERK